ncbi:MAG: 50S ribosomal protein L10 [Candidatus Micrarchaeaceae archaeon]
MLSRDQKIKFVEDAKRELKSYSTIGIVKLSNIPDRLLQSAKNSMKGSTKFIIGRKTLLERILGAEESTKKLAAQLSGTTMVILSNEDPFELYRKFKAISIKLEAKPKQLAPNDVEVKSGETSMQPGQAVTDLKSAGIDVQIQKGKVIISKDKILVKKGEMITPQVAKALHLLGIAPFVAVIEPDMMISNGVTFSKAVLGITTESTTSQMAQAFSRALALSLEAGIANSYTIGALIGRAYGNAVALGVGANIYAKGITDKLIEKAAAQASALGASVKSAA